MIEALAAHLESLDLVESVSVSGNDVIITSPHAPHYTIRLSDLEQLPYGLPSAKLENANSFGVMPHVSWSGVICVSDGESINIDHTRATDVVQKYLEDAIAILDTYELGDLDQFWDEFEGYWNAQSTDTVYFVGRLPDRCTDLRVRLNGSGRATAAFYQQTSTKQIDGFKKSACWGKQEIVGYYCPLLANVALPEPQATLGVDDVERAILAMSADDQAFLDKKLRKLKAKHKDTKNLVLVFAQPRPISGGVSLFGVSIPSGAKYFTGGIDDYRRKVAALRVLRFSESYLAERSTSESVLEEHTVAVLGCGAVGARVAELLVQCGVRALTVIDHDIYEADNVFRHILPSSDIGRAKAEALAEYLMEKYPYVEVTPYLDKVVSANTLKEIIRNPPDALIVAIGQPSMERMLNENAFAPVILFTWLEPLGLGGHAVIRDDTKGCLNCLYRKEKSLSLHPICALLKAGQPATRNLTGCAGAFVPFGAIDASKTACIATELLKDRFSNSPVSEKYACWIGRDANAKASGIETSAWFAEVSVRGTGDVIQLLSEGCPVCAGSSH